MKFINFIEEKIFFILFQISFIFLISLLLLLNDIKLDLVILLVFILIIYNIIYLILEYIKISKKEKQIINLVDNLKEKYLIAELLPKPNELINKSYYYALKKACKSMNDKISNLEKEQLEYEEYIESFVHEIKTPISALSLVFDNNKNYVLKEEVEKIDNLVEQMLFYARSDTTEKDYFIKELKLDEIIHSVLLNYKNYILKRKITLNVENNSYTVFTDEKWLKFIISQIIQNSIKYLDKNNSEITIKTEENANNIILHIIDNGCGIKTCDLPRVFDKGFTGTNRKKEHSTGMGLYLSYKLCNLLGLKITIDSVKNKYTEVKIIFPKSNIYNIKK